MKTSAWVASFAALTSLASAIPASAADTTSVPSAQSCQKDLSAFDAQLQKDGYWIHGGGYGYGYPMYGYGGMGMGVGVGMNAQSMAASSAQGTYFRARPGYEVRTLVASATILAQHGDQQACEALLSQTKEIYKTYAAEVRNGHFPRINGENWRREQIASAQPVTDSTVAYRSDQLVGTAVVDPRGTNLGSVNDIILEPQSGKIAYLVLGRGGIFGFGEDFVPVPWTDFKATANGGLLVLDTTKSRLQAAPRVMKNQFSKNGDFDAQSTKVTAYWVKPAPQ
jgi:sporulation protein YlmC with PRC-barrel domain